MKKLVPAENGEGQQRDAGSDEPGPGADGHAHEGHTLGAEVDGGGNEIQGAEERAGAEDGDGDGPEVLSPGEAGTRVAADGAKRGVGGPAGDGRAIGNEEGEHEDEEGQEGGPEGHHVETRKGHIFGADLDG